MTDLLTTPNINTLWANIIVDELVRSGLRTVVISPGSRSTPLVLQFHAHPDIHDISIIDERAAAFFAIGIAQATGQPVALLCTSGTAAANYFPAICEANQSNIPLLVLTADRPPALHDCGAPQAMNQHNLYANHIRWFHQLAEPAATTDNLLALRSITCRAIAHARGTNATQPGPVHLNIPFDKPLEPTKPTPEFTSAYTHIRQTTPVAISGRPNAQPYLQTHITHAAPAPQTVQAFVDLIKQAKRPLILAGADPHSISYRENLRRLAEHIGAPIAAEPTSNIRHWNQRGPNVLAAADLLFQSDIYHTEKPDLIIRTGRAPLLWATQKLVIAPAIQTTATQVVVNPSPELHDPDHLVSHHFACDPDLLFQQTLEVFKATQATKTPNTLWLANHQQINESILRNIHNTLENTTQFTNQLTTPGAWHAIGHLIPEDASLFVSNSMPIRDLDTFMGHANRSLNLYFNRGINGIDGIIATGLGIAHTRPKTIIITGDVAFRHDLSSLLLARELGIDATIIVLNNDGGAIFGYLPIAIPKPASTESVECPQDKIQSAFQHHFLTPSPLSISEIVPRSINLQEPTSWTEFHAAFNTSIDAVGLQVIHVQTNRISDKAFSDQLRTAASTQETPDEVTTQ